MLAVAFDTLKLARKLESAGFPPKQAQDASAALAESFAELQSTIDLATREDVRKFASDSREADMRLEARLADTKAGLERSIAETKADLIKWVIGIGFAQVAMILAVVKFHN
jgi:hypothetical protein